MTQSNQFSVTIAASSAIASLAASLSPGQSSTALGDSGFDQLTADGIQWANRFFYDHAGGRAVLLSKLANSQGSTWFHGRYSIATNSWNDGPVTSGESGHIYEGAAYSEEFGQVFFSTFAIENYFRWNLPGDALATWTNSTGWTDGSRIVWEDFGNFTIGWHPNLFGAGDGGVICLQASTNRTPCSAIAWRRSNQSWATIPGTTHATTGGYPSHGSCVWCRAGNYAIASFPGGNTYKIPAGNAGTLATGVLVDTPPVALRWPNHNTVDNSDRIGVVLDDPLGSGEVYVLENFSSSSRVWRLSGTSWVLQGYTHPFANGGPSLTPAWIAASCYPLGVFWCKAYQQANFSRIWRPG